MNPPPAISPLPRRSTTHEIDPSASAQTPEQVRQYTALIQQVMSVVMKEGEHYGRIPGCHAKPTLFKPGAEKLLFALRLAPSFVTREEHLERGHRDYQVFCTLTSIPTGVVAGQGLGLCSTMESKYRYRDDSIEPTDRLVPAAYWEAQHARDSHQMERILGGREFTVIKSEGTWRIARRAEQKAENPNIADTYNTVLKMAKKRALVDAVLTATATSDLFTQDLEENFPKTTADKVPPPARVATDPHPMAAEAEVVSADDLSTGFREVCVHFGKNCGLMLAELTEQQIRWYETDWLPKQEQSELVTAKDLTLIRALKAYRGWREAEKSQQAAQQKTAGGPD